MAGPHPANAAAGDQLDGLPNAWRECPLCSATMHPEQEWCLRCGAAANTRLAAPPRWRSLAIALALIVVVALGVIVAALVKLLG